MDANRRTARQQRRARHEAGRDAHLRPGVFGRLVHAFVAIGLILSSPGGIPFASAQVASIGIDEVEAAVDEVYGPLERARAALDPTLYDIKELAFELAFEDADAIVAHVHDEIAFEPYEGVLRGAQGTLASAAGNAWDQALMTGRLLADAGYDVELRRAELDDAQVDRLLDRVRARSASDLGPDVELSAIVDVGDPDELRAELEDRLAAFDAEVREIDDVVARLPTGASDEALEQVREAVRDYAWVAYRLGSDGGWSEAHPVLGPDTELDVEARETFEGELPEDVQHRFGYQVFVEQRLGDSLAAQPVTEAWERPTANLYGVPLNFVNLPDGVDEADADATPADILAETSYLFPMVDGDIAPGGQAFEMGGAVVPMDAAQSPFGEIFQSIGGDLGDAAGALGAIGGNGDEDPDDFVALSAQWIEFTLIAPGGERTTHRRYVVDRVGAEARSEGRISLDAGIDEEAAFEALMSSHTFMLDTGRYGDAYLAARISDALLATRPYVEQAWEAAYGGPAAVAPSAEGAADQAVIAPISLYGMFGDAPIDDDLVSFRPAPALTVLSQRLDGSRPQVDVVANPRWSLRTGGPDGPTFDAAATRRLGVWETRMEGVLLAERGVSFVPAIDALSSVPAEELRTLAPGDEEAVRELALPAASRAAIVDDLQRGYGVLTPSRLADGQEAAGWWRVDPRSGETLGRGADGRGAAGLEYVTTLELAGSILAATFFTVKGVHECTKIEDAEKAGCCIVQNMVLAGAGFAAGLALGLALGLSSLAGFLVLDVGGGFASSMIPSVCGS